MDLDVMTLYRLEANGTLLCEVVVEHPEWLPVRPKLNRKWLNGLIQQALRSYLNKRVFKA